MRRRVLLAVLAVLSIVVMGCDLRTTAPPGTAPVRYRDAVFTTVVTTSDITFGSAVNQQGQTVTLKLDFYVPSGDTVTKRPAIVWVHGGSFSSRRQDLRRAGRRGHDVRQEGLRERVDQLPAAPSGCSAGAPTADCVTPSSTPSTTPRPRCASCGPTPPTYGVDPTRIAIGGTSAGAITALNVGFDPTDLGTAATPASRRPSGRGLAVGRRHPHHADARRCAEPAVPRHGRSAGALPVGRRHPGRRHRRRARVRAHHVDRRRPRPLLPLSATRS